MMKGASQIAPFGLRMPEALKDAIAERAKANGRSMNAEIIHILEKHVDLSAAEKITPYLESTRISHFDKDGVINLETAKDIVDYIDKRTEEYKKEMLDGLLAIAKGGITSKYED